MMESGTNLWAEVDEQGRVVLPVEASDFYGVKPGARLRIEKNQSSALASINAPFD
jgi:bifunctional DNA-binding transcriptional regulator/antitoxin component of YhaV-PrlF toxin-antitoxin module